MQQPEGRPGGMGGLHMPGGRFAGGQKPRDMKGTLRRLWALCAGQKAKIIGNFLLATAGSALGLVGPLLIGLAVDAMDAAGVDFPLLYRLIFWLAVAYGAGALLSWLQQWWIAGVSQRIVQILRKALFDNVQRLPLSYFDSHPHGELMSRLTNDVDNVSTMLSTSTTQLFSSALMVLGSLGMMLVLSPPLTGLTLLTVPLTLLISNAVARRSRRLFKQQQMHLATLNGHIEEILSGQLIVQAFSRQEHVTEQFDQVNEKLRASGVKAQLLAGLVMPMLNVVTNIGFIIVATAGGAFAVAGAITVGVITSFINYSRQFTRPLNDIANLYSTIQSAQASAERIFDLMDEKPEAPDGPDALPLTSPQGRVVFDGVNFAYTPGVPVLEDISLEAEPGRTVALVGPTGSGKTTIVSLLVRFYDPDSGVIRLDGRDMTGWTRGSLRRSFGIVLQDTHLFSGTVRENIRYGRLEATDGEVEEAARLVGADAFIRRLPDGYDTALDESGGGFSQGQRQLISIARAVLADPSVLILDEATSSVDTRTEMVLQQAMISLRRGRTSFIIAHRLSTIRDADEILVIDQGRILERGSHSQLMARGGFYHKLYSGQFSM